MAKVKIDPEFYTKYQTMLADVKTIREEIDAIRALKYYSYWELKTKYNDFYKKEDEILQFGASFEGVVPGRILEFMDADESFSYYLLTEYDDEICLVEFLEIGDGLSSIAVSKSGKILTETVIENLESKI